MAEKYDTYHRRSIRLKGYDYSQEGAYFVTICTQDREHRFGEIVNGEMVLSDLGRIAQEQWEQIPARFEQVELGEFVIMPNHIHGIIIIEDERVGDGAGASPIGDGAWARPIGEGVGARPIGEGVGDDKWVGEGVGASPTPTTDDDQIEGSGQPQGLPLRARATVGDIVGAYKSLTANECLRLFKSKDETMGKIWQRNYYEHIIRDEEAYLRIAQYIFDNPAQWEVDSLNPGNMP